MRPGEQQNHAPLRVVPRPDHNISRADISPNAIKVLYRLKNAGHAAFLVGGGVRDLLLGREPKDFDVATDADPDTVRGLFRNCRLVGRRFRLAHIRFGNEIIEVATFRAAAEEPREQDFHLDTAGRILRDNVYGTLEEDAWRRDFTVNALYYNIADFSVLDYTDGLADLRAGVLRVIGDPERRYQEDPVRMLRAVRFATKLGFRLENETEASLQQNSALLADIPPARLYDEVLKLFFGGSALQTFEQLRHYGLFGYLFPQAEVSLGREENHFPKTLIAHALANTDDRIRDGKPVTPAFLFASVLWDSVEQFAVRLIEDGATPLQALQTAADEVIRLQVQHIAIPKRIGLPMREIWLMQPRLEQIRGKRPLRLLENPRFRAAYDFLLLRAEADGSLRERADWWTKIQEVDEPARHEMAAAPAGSRGRRRRRRRPRKRPEA